MTKWTEEQQLAINKEGSNIIVSAGAGSGKTAVLSERVLRKLKSGVPIDHLLVLTFTKDAAAEMKERIRTKISNEPSLSDQLDFIDQAYITTFDSYALSIVKKYHYLIGVSKDIDIVDSSIIDILKNNYLSDILANLYEEKDEDFLKLVSDFCYKDDKNLYNIILSLNKSLDLRYDKKEYLINYVNNYYNDSYFNSLLEQFNLLIDDKLNKVSKIIQEMKDILGDDFCDKNKLYFGRFLNAKTYDDAKEICELKSPKIPNRDGLDILKKKRDKILDELNSYTIYDYGELHDIYFSTKPYVKAIIKIILELDCRVDEFKLKKNSFEFVDIAKMAIDVVNDNPDVLNELKYYYNEIMVDEYQDTNDLQEMFISKIANNNVYMVGDIKQSIYRFRNANPFIFKNKYEKYANLDGGVKIDLLKNFRSRNEVLDDINVLFDKIMDSNIGGAEYKESHRMVFGNNVYSLNDSKEINHHLEIYNYDDSDKTYTPAEKEIFIIANDIINKIKSEYKVLDKETEVLRPAKYSDFCIIIDRGTDFDNYRKIFEYMGIPLSVNCDQKLTVEYDIYTIKNLYKLILLLSDNVKLDDKELLYCYTSVARSFLCSYSDQDIYMALNDVNYLKKSDLYKKCLNISKDVNKMTSVMLLDRIIKDFSYYEKLISAFDVDKAMIRVEYLKKIAIDLEELGFNNKMFLDYLDMMINDQDNDITFKINSDVGDSVKLMSIHKSKGLEFSVCYFAGFYKKFNRKDVDVKFLYDNKYGIITPYYKDGIGNFINKHLYVNKFYHDEISEKIRLFYVAVTRAKEKMIIVAPLKENDESFTSVVEDDTRLNFRSFLDILEAIYQEISLYIKDIDISKIDISKEYNKVKDFNYDKYIPKCDISMKEISNNLLFEKETSKHFSKSTVNLITSDDKINMENGIKMHEDFEREDFSDTMNVHVLKFLKHEEIKDISKAKIYKEYEFSYDLDNVNYHGIIDLLLIYDDYAIIVDYKMYNIDDDAYRNQLSGYKSYIEGKTGLKVKTYLYAIIPDLLKEIN